MNPDVGSPAPPGAPAEKSTADGPLMTPSRKMTSGSSKSATKSEDPPGKSPERSASDKLKESSTPEGIANPEQSDTNFDSPAGTTTNINASPPYPKLHVGHIKPLVSSNETSEVAGQGADAKLLTNPGGKPKLANPSGVTNVESSDNPSRKPTFENPSVDENVELSDNPGGKSKLANLSEDDELLASLGGKSELTNSSGDANIRSIDDPSGKPELANLSGDAKVSARPSEKSEPPAPRGNTKLLADPSGKPELVNLSGNTESLAGLSGKHDGKHELNDPSGDIKSLVSPSERSTLTNPTKDTKSLASSSGTSEISSPSGDINLLSGRSGKINLDDLQSQMFKLANDLTDIGERVKSIEQEKTELAISTSLEKLELKTENEHLRETLLALNTRVGELEVANKTSDCKTHNTWCLAKKLQKEMNAMDKFLLLNLHPNPTAAEESGNVIPPDDTTEAAPQSTTDATFS